MLKLKLFILLTSMFASNMYAMTQDDLPGTPDTPESIRHNSPTPPRKQNHRSENKNAMIASPTQTDNDRPTGSRIQHFHIQIDAPPAEDLEALFYRTCEGNDLKDAKRALFDYSDKPWIIGQALKKATNPAIRELLINQLISIGTSLEIDNQDKRATIIRLLEENNKLTLENTQLKAPKNNGKCVIL